MRPRLLAALAALVLVGGCGGDSGGRSAEQVLKSASQKEARSADLDIALELKVVGVERLKEPIKLAMKGPYRSNGTRKLPDFDFRISYTGAGQNGDVRVIGAAQNAFVEFRGQTYEVGTELVRRLLSQSQARAQEDELRKLGINGARWLKDGEVEDGGRTVTGELDVPRMLSDVNRVIAKTPGARQFPQTTIDQIDQSVEDASLEVRVGQDDVLRSSTFDLSFEPTDELRSKARGLERGELSFRFGQSNVNGNQRIEAPSGARPVEELLRGLGVPPELLLGPGFSPQAPG